MSNLDILHLRDISLEQLERVWPTVRGRPDVTMRRAAAGPGLELTGYGLQRLGAELSRRLDADVTLFQACSSVGYVAVHAWRGGALVRHLEYTHEQGGWQLVAGQAQPWERALAVPPRVGARDSNLFLTQGQNLLHALGGARAWASPTPLPGEARDDRWIAAALIGGALAVVLLIYVYLRASGAPG